MEHVIAARPELVAPKYEDLAELIDLALLRTDLSEAGVAEGCAEAKRLGVASVIVRPCDIDLAVNWLRGSRIVLGTIVDVPHGYSSPSVKNYAARDMLRRGVREIDTVMNTGKLISRQFQYVETELMQMAESCHESGAVLRVGLESEFLDDERKILACRICRRAGVDFLATPNAADLPLLKEYAKDRLKLKLTTAPAAFEEALRLRGAGVARIQSNDPGALLGAWRAHLDALAEAAKNAEATENSMKAAADAVTN